MSLSVSRAPQDRLRGQSPTDARGLAAPRGTGPGVLGKSCSSSPATGSWALLLLLDTSVDTGPGQRGRRCSHLLPAPPPPRPQGQDFLLTARVATRVRDRRRPSLPVDSVTEPSERPHPSWPRPLWPPAVLSHLPPCTPQEVGVLAHFAAQEGEARGGDWVS